MESALDIGKKLVALCKEGKNADAIETLYAPNVVAIEPQEGPGMPARQEGIKAIKAKNEWWLQNHTVHSHEVKGPWPHGDRFIVYFKYDVTGTGGPMKGKRMTMEETGLFAVKNGKIVQEEFFYHM